MERPGSYATPRATLVPMTSLPQAPELPHGDPRVVAGMFGRIARRYDLMNRLLSFGIDGGWRRFSARQARLRLGDKALDIASGTGDLAFELAKSVGPTAASSASTSRTRCSCSAVEKGAPARRNHRVDHHEGDAMALPYADNVFRATTMAFGGRNVPDLTGAFREMNRVMQPGGRAVFLELNRPAHVRLQAAVRLLLPHLLAAGRRPRLRRPRAPTATCRAP